MVNAAGVTAAMLVDKNKRVSLRWEINTYLSKFNKRGALLCQQTWLPCHDKIKKSPCHKSVCYCKLEGRYKQLHALMTPYNQSKIVLDCNVYDPGLFMKNLRGVIGAYSTYTPFPICTNWLYFIWGLGRGGGGGRFFYLVLSKFQPIP